MSSASYHMPHDHAFIHHLASYPITPAWYSYASMHHTGFPTDVTPVVQEEPEGEGQQGAVLQEAAEDEDPKANLPECPDHQPSCFEKGKSRSISPCNFTNNLFCVPYCL